MPGLRAARRRIITALVVSSTAVATMALGTGTADAASLAPKLSWSPTTSSNTFDFGNVTVGAASTQTFTLRNSGLFPSGALTISLMGSGAFAVAANSCTRANLGLNKTCSVTVRYAPSTVGESDATLSARGALFGARASLTLRGTGVVTTGTLTATYTFADGLSVSGSGLVPGSEVDVHFQGAPPDLPGGDFAVGTTGANGAFTWTGRPPCYWHDIYFTGTDSFGSVTSNTIFKGPYC